LPVQTCVYVAQKSMLPGSFANYSFERHFTVKDYSTVSSGIKFAHVLFSSFCFSLSRGGTRWGLCWSGYNNLPLLRALFTNRTRRVDRALSTHPELPRATASTLV